MQEEKIDYTQKLITGIKKMTSVNILRFKRAMMRKRMTLETCRIPLTKIYLKWIKDLNIRPETVKVLEENIWQKLFDIGLGNDFIGFHIKSTGNKSRNKQVGQHPTKICLHSKGNNRQNQKATFGNGENICKPYT